MNAANDNGKKRNTYDAGSGVLFKKQRNGRWLTDKISGKSGDYLLTVEHDKEHGWSYMLQEVGSQQGIGTFSFATEYRAMDAAVAYLWSVDRG